MATLICLSFIISEKTAVVVNDMDELMTEIKDKADSYYVGGVDAVIDDTGMVPGLYGKRVNVKKSYSEMKKIGFFCDKYLVYDDVEPNVSLKDNYDKVIISGNRLKNTVSLMFNVSSSDDIGAILDVLNREDVKATFFVDGNWFESNNELTLSLIKEGHTVGNLAYGMNYQKAEYVWMNNIFRTLGKQKINYCYDTGNVDDLKACALQMSYTVRPSIVVGSNPMMEIKKQIKAGSLISLDVNEKVNSELGLIVSYIKSRGYRLDNLTNHLSEKNSN